MSQLFGYHCLIKFKQTVLALIVSLDLPHIRLVCLILLSKTIQQSVVIANTDQSRKVTIFRLLRTHMKRVDRKRKHS